MSRPRLRSILHTEASLGLGGQEIRILTEVRWLLEHGWDALIACQPESRLRAEAERARLPVVALAMRSSRDVRALWALRRLVRERRIALVHTHSSIDSWLATLAARSLGRPVVRSRHVAIPIRPWRGIVYRLADRVITSGDAISALVVRARVPRTRVRSIAAGVDTTQFHPGVSGTRVREELGLGVRAPVVGLVANVRGSKGHRYFLEAVPAIVREVREARFLIVGDGVGYDEVRRRVHETGLAGYVVMAGFRRDIPRVLAALDVLTLPSIRSEGISQVLLQALAVGTPVVATTIGGSPEVVRDGETGRLVPPADAAALAGAILDVLRDPERAQEMARAGQRLVQERFTLDAMMEVTTRLYEDLLGG